MTATHEESFQKKLVKISDIYSPPVNCTVSTQSNIEKFAEIAKSTPELLPAITLGKTSDGNLYAINHHDVIFGCKKAGSNIITKIPAVVINNFSGSADILIAHVRESITNEPFNPLSIYEIIDYLEERNQLDKKQILKLLWLNDTPYEKLILSNNFISHAAIELLQKIINRLSERKNLPIQQMQIPLYVVSRISRIKEEQDQLKIISEISVDLDSISDAKFAWPTPEQMYTMSRYNRQESSHEENQREESIVAVTTGIQNIGKLTDKAKEIQEQTISRQKDHHPNNVRTQNIKKETDNGSAIIDDETKLIKKSIPNMIIIPDEKTGKPSILVNKKTGAVAKIEKNSQTKDIIKTSTVNSKTLCAMPMDVSSHLKLDENNDKTITMHKNFDSTSELEKFLKMFSRSSQKDIKLSLFWNAVTS